MIDVAGREPQDAEAGVDEGVLAPVVLHQAIAVVAPVEFDHETGVGVIEVGAATNRPSSPASGTWTWGRGIPRRKQQPPQSRFHR